jgi:small subunit ribosomal protein S5
MQEEKSRRESELVEKMIFINRVSKTVKGGRTLSFSALVVVGDRRGRVGYGHGKAKEVPEAIKKASDHARKSLIRVSLKDGRTLHQDIVGKWGAGTVLMKSAKAGRGIIAGGALRTVFDLLGVQDVVAKSLGSTNPYNLVKACFDGLQRQHAPRYIAYKRDLKISQIFGKQEAA